MKLSSNNANEMRVLPKKLEVTFPPMARKANPSLVTTNALVALRRTGSPGMPGNPSVPGTPGLPMVPLQPSRPGRPLGPDWPG